MSPTLEQKLLEQGLSQTEKESYHFKTQFMVKLFSATAISQHRLDSLSQRLRLLQLAQNLIKECLTLYELFPKLHDVSTRYIHTQVGAINLKNLSQHDGFCFCLGEQHHWPSPGVGVVSELASLRLLSPWAAARAIPPR
jgi:hypothetical protein